MKRRRPKTRAGGRGTAGVLLLFAACAAAQETPSALVYQQTSGWCSPAIANVTGNVVVNCNGISPKLLARVNAELSRTKAALTEQVRRADEWVQRYNDLKGQLAEYPNDDELARVARKLLEDGDLESAGAIIDRMLDSGEKQVERTAANHFNRAAIFDLQFEHAKALPHYERAYRYRPDETRYALGYALALSGQGNRALMEEVCVKLAAALRAKLAAGEDAAERGRLAFTLALLGSSHSHSNRLAEAEKMYLQSAAEYRKAAKGDAGPYDAMLGEVLQRLARLYRKQGRRPECEAAYVEACSIYRGLAARDTGYETNLTEALSELVWYYRDGRIADAWKLMEEADPIFKRVTTAGVAADPKRAKVLTNLGRLYFGMLRYDKAETAYRNASAVYELLAQRNPDAFEPEWADMLVDFGALYQNQQRRKEAAQTYEMSCAIYRRAVTRNAQYLPDLAHTLVAAGPYLDAKVQESAYEEARGIYAKLAAREPDAYEPGLASSLQRLGGVYSSTGRKEEAAKMYVQAREIFARLAARIPALYSGELATACSILGHLYNESGSYDQAEKAYREAYEVRSRLAKDDLAEHGFALSLVLENLVALYRRAGRLKEAEQGLLENVQVLARLAARSDVDKPYLARSLEELGELYASQQRVEEALKQMEDARALYRPLWKANPEWYAKDMGRVAFNAAVLMGRAARPRPEVCAAAMEAIRATPDPDLASRARELATGCPPAAESLPVANAEKEPAPTGAGAVQAAPPAPQPPARAIAVGSAKEHNDRGMALFEKQEYAAAVQAFTAALELEPNSPDAYYNRACAYLGTMDFDRTIADADRALQLRPGWGAVYAIRWSAYYRKDDLARALADLNMAIRNTRTLDLLYYRGEVHRRLGRTAEAISDYQAVLEMPGLSIRKGQAHDRLKELQAGQ